MLQRLIDGLFDLKKKKIFSIQRFDSLEKGEYPSLKEVIDLLHRNYDHERLIRSAIIDEFDCILPHHLSDDKEIFQHVEDYQKKKGEAIKLAKQRDATIFLQFFGDNPFWNGTTNTEETEFTEEANPFLD